MRPFLPVVLSAAFIALGAPLSFAQTAADQHGLVTTGDCAVAPSSDALAPDTAAPNSLTDTLAPCDGVLAPPAVGDGEMMVAPPALGETPIIPPEMVPPQPPQE